MDGLITVLQIFGWCILAAALVFTVVVRCVHSKGRNTPWVRAAWPSEIDYVSRKDESDWRQLLSDALSDGLQVDEILFRYVGTPRVFLGIKFAEVDDTWEILSNHATTPRIRITLPGEQWQQSLAASEVLTTGRDSVPDTIKQMVFGLRGVSVDWQTAEVRMRASQVVIDVSAEIPSDMPISSRWVESLRMTDATLLYVIAAAVIALGAVLTLTNIGITIGVVVFVALSGMCKFIFMSRRSDPTREEYLQNY